MIMLKVLIWLLNNNLFLYPRSSIYVFQPKALQSKFEEKAVKYDGDGTAADLKTFVTEKT